MPRPHLLALACATLIATPAHGSGWSSLFIFGRTGTLQVNALGYAFDSGSWSADLMEVGYTQSASVTQNGGSFSAGTMTLGGSFPTAGVSGSGRHTLNAGPLLSTRLHVAQFDGGVLIQNGGLNSVDGELKLGNDACCRGNTGRLELNLGLLSAHSLGVGYNRYMQSGGIAVIGGAGVVTGGGSLTLAGGSLQVTGGLHVERAHLRRGTVAAELDIAGGSLLGNVTNDGEFLARGGSVTGDIVNQPEGVLTVSGAFAHAGLLSNRGTATFSSQAGLKLQGGTLVNKAEGVLRLDGGTLSGTGQMFNGGRFFATGAITIDGPVGNAGVMTVQGGTLKLGVSKLDNSATLQLDSARLDGGRLSNQGTGTVAVAGDTTLTTGLGG